MNSLPKKIAIIDDDRITQKLYHDILIKEGYMVVQAFNRQEGLNLIKFSHTDLIVWGMSSVNLKFLMLPLLMLPL